VSVIVSYAHQKTDTPQTKNVLQYICFMQLIWKWSFWIFAASSSLLHSCAVTKYQVVETEWNSALLNIPNYYTADSALLVSYNLWSSGGKLRVSISNLSEHAIALDLKESFITSGIDTFYYYEPSKIIDSAAVHAYFLKNARYLDEPLKEANLFPSDSIFELGPQQTILLNKFHLNSFLNLTLDYKKNYGNSQQFDALTTPKEFGHTLKFLQTDSTHWGTTSQQFYISGIKSWTTVKPAKIYRRTPQGKQRSRFYVVDKGISSFGTAMLFTAIMVALALSGG
jgi:hypothetical protein